MSMPKYLILTFEEVNFDEFMNYINHLEDYHHMKITIQRKGDKDLYFGEDPAGNKELYAIMNTKKEADED